jgi:hypothetical protein
LRDNFFEGGKAALAFKGRNGTHGEKVFLERQIEELQKLIGEQAVEIRFFKTAVEELRPSWAELEAARVAEGLNVKQAIQLLGLSRSSYYWQVRGMKDYRVRSRKVVLSQYREVLRAVALKRWKRATVGCELTLWRGEISVQMLLGAAG